MGGILRVLLDGRGGYAGAVEFVKIRSRKMRERKNMIERLGGESQT